MTLTVELSIFDGEASGASRFHCQPTSENRRKTEKSWREFLHRKRSSTWIDQKNLFSLLKIIYYRKQYNFQTFFKSIFN
jgi:hypothetical protein